jgi:cysteine desulfurase
MVNMMKQKVIYLDYAATTPVDPRVAEKMAAYLTTDGVFANPSSMHAPGRAARAAVEKARAEVAALINADTPEMVWTSGATESDNLAIKGVLHFHKDKRRHIVTSRIEHKAVLDTCKQLEREGFTVTYLKPDSDGLSQPDAVAAAMQDDTALVSIMHVNNEIGTANDIAAISAAVHAGGALLHVDAAQSAGKLPIDVKAMNVDLLSLSGHKVYGPKGVGALFVRRQPRVNLEPMVHGGQHEAGMRSGTLATHQIVGMGEAYRIAREQLAEEVPQLTALRERLWQALHRGVPDALLNGHASQRVAGSLNLSFPGIEGESLLFGCFGLAVSSGSACSAANAEPSYVLRALGRDDELAGASLRFSLGRFTTAEDVDAAARIVIDEYRRLRALAPAG